MTNGKAKRWQFGLTWLFVATLAVALCCVLWNADPADWSIVTSWGSSLVLPAGSVSGAIFFRGYRRAFFIGMAVTQVIWATNAVYQTEHVIFMTTQAAPDPLALSTTSFLVNADGFAKGTAGVIGLSVLAGLLAAAVRWFAVRTGDAAPHD